MTATASPQRLSGFFAYPSQPREIGATVRETLNSLSHLSTVPAVTTWEQNDIAGRFLVDPILAQLESSSFLLADITKLNFNVTYEIGYAIGQRKRAVLVCNRSLKRDQSEIDRVGLYDTLGYERYANSIELGRIIERIKDVAPLAFDSHKVRMSSPLFVITPQVKTDAEIRLFARLKKARLEFRSYDPEESGRLDARTAIRSVAESHGVVVPLLANTHAEAGVHNQRGAFVIGLAHGMQKECLILQAGDDPVPLDYRDLVTSYRHLDQIDEAIATLAPAITALLQKSSQIAPEQLVSLLANIDLGASAAENEISELGRYYLETDEYRRTLRGEVQLVVGRKGAGKTALFVQVRNRLRQHKARVVLDLKPEGYQLLKFQDQVLSLLGAGTQEHTIGAFWEYLLLLEICHKVLTSDKESHLHNHLLFEPYQRLAKTYADDRFVKEGDFAERITALTHRITADFEQELAREPGKTLLSRDEITGILYRHDIHALQRDLIEYVRHKESVWILFDNLDKGWPAHGISAKDLVTLRGLLHALAGLQRTFAREEIKCTGTVFIRNDVYEHLVAGMPDRGKTSSVSLDWSDPSLLRELLRRRLVASGSLDGKLSFEDAWSRIAISHIDGEESSQYLIDRCLMRPRGLIDLVQACRGHAVNLGHARMEQDDLLHGEEHYSTNLVNNISYEIRDVMPSAKDVLYEFINAPREMSRAAVSERTHRGSADAEQVLDLLLWYGFLGLRRPGGEISYIYTVKYDAKRLAALVRSAGADAVFCINPAFWRGLEVTES